MDKSRLRDTPSEAWKHHLIGNSLALDFANTLYGHVGEPIHEYLYGYADLVIWSVKAGIVDETDGYKLIRRAGRQTYDAQSVFRLAIALRETIYRAFASVARGQPISNSDLLALNRARQVAIDHSQMAQTSGGYRLVWDDPIALDRMLWPISISASELLVSSSLARVHQCDGETCDWLFVDTSRNHMRRWCQMKVCGNRAKARRFVQRRGARSAI